MYIRIQICLPRFEANGVLTDVCSCFGRVVAEAIISQPRLCVEVLPLVQEGHQPHFALLYTHTPIDVQLKSLFLENLHALFHKSTSSSP